MSIREELVTAPDDSIVHRLADHGDPDLVALAYEAGRRRLRSAVSNLALLLTAVDRDVSLGAIEALGEIGDDQAGQPILHLLKNATDRSLRDTAAWTLGLLRYRPAVQTLAWMLSASEPTVRSCAAAAVVAIGDKTVWPAVQFQLERETNPAYGPISWLRQRPCGHEATRRERRQRAKPRDFLPTWAPMIRGNSRRLGISRCQGCQIMGEQPSMPLEIDEALQELGLQYVYQPSSEGKGGWHVAFAAADGSQVVLTVYAGPLVVGVIHVVGDMSKGWRLPDSQWVLREFADLWLTKMVIQDELVSVTAQIPAGHVNRSTLSLAISGVLEGARRVKTRM